MQHIRFGAIAFAITIAWQCSPAMAQSSRTFVSGHGVDTNPCSLTAPCRTLQQALTQTNANGEIAVLDTAGYGAFTITKAVSIFAADGIEAGVAASPGDAITINAGATDVINLRGLTINGSGTGGNGIVFNTGASVNVQNCVIRGFTHAGFFAAPTTGARFTIVDTSVINNQTGILVAPPSAASLTLVLVSLERDQLLSNVDGYNAAPGASFGGFLSTNVNNSAVVGNTGSGFANNGPLSFINLTNTDVLNNGTGLLVNEGLVTLSQTTITGNSVSPYTVGLGGGINTFKNNIISLNGSTGTGTLMPVTGQ